MGWKLNDFIEAQKRLARTPEPVRQAPVAPNDTAPQASRYDTPMVRRAMLEVGLLIPIFEYRFHAGRKWRFDMAWPSQKVAIEVQGGLFKGRPCPTCGMRSGGRHNQPAALKKEYEKLNAAAEMGWRILYALPEDLQHFLFLAQVRATLQ